MARQVFEKLYDDLDGSEGASTIRFAFEGKAYEIDLSEGNASQLRNSLAMFVQHARPAKNGDGKHRDPRDTKSRAQATALRAWAKQHGYQVSDRGRISADVREAYEKQAVK